VNVIFDKEVRDESITIFIKDLPFDEALSLILNTNGLMSQKVANDTILIMPLNKQKQAQYQDLLMRTFYLSNAKAKEAVNLVRTLLDSKKIYVDEKVNAIVVRDEPAKLQLAERLLFAIDRREPEVELDLEVLEVNRTKSLKYGLNYAKQAGTGIIPPGGSGGISTNPTTFSFQQLTSIGPESYIFTLPASVLIDFFKQDSDAKTLASPKLRVMNNKSASVNIGEKQPILLSTTNVLPGQATTGAIPTTSTVTSIEFKDTGVKLSVEPSVNLTDEVTLKIKVEVTRLGDQVTLQASPEIKQFRFGTRTAETVLMLKDDETVVLAGLIQEDQRTTKSTVPLLGDIPWIGNLFTSTAFDRVTTEVVLTITPRVVRTMGAPPVAQQAFWSGTENTYTTSQLFPPRALAISQNTNKTSMASKAQVPVATNSAGQQVSQTHFAGPESGAQTQIFSTPSSSAIQDGLPKTVRLSEGFSFRPDELSTALGQEFRLDLLTSQLELLTEAALTVAYDPELLEFRRIMPGAAAIASRNTDGQVIVTLRQQTTGSGEAVLGTLVFHTKGEGDAVLKMDVALPGLPQAPSGLPVSRQTVVHVR
jgi:general secretion pathway protein D